MTVRAWSTPADVVTRVRRRWQDQSLLTAYLHGDPCPTIEVPLRGPGPSEIGADLSRVRGWASALEAASADGRAFALAHRDVGGRVVGRNRLPSRAVVTTYDQAWRVLGVRDDVRTLERLVADTQEQRPALVPWVRGHPLTVLDAAPHWSRLLAATGWLAEHAGRRGLYLRQITAPGVDTKFVVAHRRLLATLLEEVLPADVIDERHSRGAGFGERFGFATPQQLVRLRVGPGFAGFPDAVTELGLRPRELASLRVGVDQVLVVENEVTYLAVPVPADGVVIWGAGYSVAQAARAPWVQQAGEVTMWADLDTHGFAGLDMLRAWVPGARSLLMDRVTLLAHRERWGAEPTPTRAALTRLTREEQTLYQELIEDVHAPALRLEQERIDWGWVEQALGGAGWSR